MAAPRRSQKGDDDSYWESSSASKLGRGINIFDDNVDLNETKKKLMMFDDDEDDDGDMINWDGTPAPGARPDMSGSVRFRPAKTGTTGGATTPKGPAQSDLSTPVPRSGSSGSLQGYTQPNHFGHNRTPSNSSQKDRITWTRDNLPKAGSAASLEEAIHGGPQTQVTHTEVAKLQAKIQSLERQLQVARKDKFAKIPPEDMIRRIIFGMPYHLEMYKSKEDKIELLDAACKMHDGNAILAIVLFLKNTIEKGFFNNALMQRPEATSHYVSYLRQNLDFEELVDLLGMLGRSEEAAMLKYKQATTLTRAEDKKKMLQHCYSAHLQPELNLSHEAGLVAEHISLLERQLPVEQQDIADEKLGAIKFKHLPRLASLVNQSVLTTLYYCSLYHYGLSENSLASPQAIKRAHGLNDKQYLWTVVRARARVKCWTDLENLFQTKGWFGTKMKSVIGFDNVVALIHKEGAPRDILNRYCKLIEDTELRLETATKYQCYEAAVDTFVSMKDRQGLMQYSQSLPAQSPQARYASDALRGNTKWRN